MKEKSARHYFPRPYLSRKGTFDLFLKSECVFGRFVFVQRSRLSCGGPDDAGLIRLP